MNTPTQLTKQSIIPALITAIAVVTFTFPAMSHADGWELRTVSDEVPGTREIESGNAEKANGKSIRNCPASAEAVKRLA